MEMAMEREMEAGERPGFGGSRTKHMLPPPEEGAAGGQLDAYPNDRFHYGLFEFLQKRRGGGGGSTGSAGSSSRGSSPSKPAAPKSKPPASKPPTSRPKAPVLAPPKGLKLPKGPKLPKLPKVPKLPKPDSGWKPPMGSLPGSAPGHPPYHGSGGHPPVIVGSGDQSHDHGKHHAAPPHSCIHPKGMARLRCQEPDAIIATLVAIIACILAPFLIYLCIRRCKRRRAKKNGRGEDGMEMGWGGMECDPGVQSEREGSGSVSDLGLAINSSDETLAKGRTRDQSFDGSHGRKSISTDEGRPGSVSRGRKFSRDTSSIRNSSSLSSGMIRTARLGLALQDAAIVDVPPSVASSRKNSERMDESGEVERWDDGELIAARRPSSVLQSCECFDIRGPRMACCIERLDSQIPGGEWFDASEYKDDDARSTSPGPGPRPDSQANTPEGSVRRPEPPVRCEEDSYYSLTSESSTDSQRDPTQWM